MDSLKPDGLDLYQRVTPIREIPRTEVPMHKYLKAQESIVSFMDPFSRVKGYYLQGAPSKIVIEEIKKCSDWKEESFQDRVVNEAIDSWVSIIVRSSIIH